MSIKTTNPDNTLLQQLEEHWQKIAMFLLWKLAGTEKVTITDKDMADMAVHFAPGLPCLYTHGHKDSIDFQLITEESARRLAGHNATMKGHG